MMRPELIHRAQAYCQRNGLALGRQLGFGVHGIVFLAEGHAPGGQSAVKAHEREADYRRERDVYLRLQEHEVRRLRDCAVPQLQAILRDLEGCGVFVIDVTPNNIVLDV